MRRTTRCPGCGWQSTRRLSVIVGRGDRPRVVVYDPAVVPVKGLHRDADQVYAWARSGWQGVAHACIATPEMIEVRASHDHARLLHWIRVAAVITGLCLAGLLCWWLIHLPAALILLAVMLLTATGFTVADQLDLDPADARGVEVWRRDKRNRHR